MSSALIFGLIATILNFIGYVPYIRDIVRRKVVPQRVTWGIWSVLTSIGAVNQIVNGGGWSSLFFISTSVLVVITFCLSLRLGVGGGSKLDYAVLALAGVLFAYWILSRDSISSTYIAIIIDLVGLAPTVLKVWRNPATETYIQWVLAAIGGIFTVLAVGSLDKFVLLAYPIYIFFGNGAIIATKLLRSKYTKV
jgi:hypothetical protein